MKPTEIQRAKSRLSSKLWRDRNLERARAYGRRYEKERRAKHGNKVREMQMAAYRRRCAVDPERMRAPRSRQAMRYINKRKEVRILFNIRRRVNLVLHGKKKLARTLELLGCSAEHLRVWLTFYFQPGMTWANYGKVWHIDHRRPCASFDLSDPAQQRECFHYTNLQPLFAADNLRKGAHYSE